MSDIYSGSFVSIAASSAVSSNGGLFGPRDPPSITPCVMPVCVQARGWHHETCVVWAEGYLQTPIVKAPLYKRGWVLQERLLAPRNVHLTSEKIFWECPHLFASETDPHGDFHYYKSTNLTEGWSVPPERQHSQNAQLEKCMDKWIKAAQLYSLCDLTYESDKLVAIAGIAKYLQSLWLDPPTKYLAGHWSNDFVHSLLWYRSGPADSSLHPKNTERLAGPGQQPLER